MKKAPKNGAFYLFRANYSFGGANAAPPPPPSPPPKPPPPKLLPPPSYDEEEPLSLKPLLSLFDFDLAGDVSPTGTIKGVCVVV